MQKKKPKIKIILELATAVLYNHFSARQVINQGFKRSFVSLPVVNLPVLAELEGELVSLPHPDTGDGGVVVLAEQADGGEGVLPQLLQSL